MHKYSEELVAYYHPISYTWNFATIRIIIKLSTKVGYLRIIRVRSLRALLVLLATTESLVDPIPVLKAFFLM